MPPTHPLPERPASPASHVRVPAPPRNKRLPPSDSLPVQAWGAMSDSPNIRYKPLFGSFPDRLPINSTPRLSALDRELASSPVESHPSPAMFGPDGPLERITRQRGKVLVTEGDARELGGGKDAQTSPLGQDQEGWFTVDQKRQAAIASGGAGNNNGKPKLEFGQFASSGSSSSAFVPRAAASGSYDYRASSSGARRQGGAGMNGARQSRSGSLSGDIVNGGGGGGGPRHTSQPYHGPNGHPRRGSQRVNRGSGYGPGRSSSAFAGPAGGGGNRSMNGSGFRQPLPPRPYAYDAQQDPYGMGAVPPEYGGSYYGGAPGMYPPYVPYGYGVPMTSPAAYPSVTPGGQAGPPIPMPITQTQFALDPLRYWLLGQIEYYFSLQNLANDLFLRRQMDHEGWLEISIIASFNRIQNLTQDFNLVRDTMSLSAYLEVSEDRVRLAHRRWQDFVLPSTPISMQDATLPSSATMSASSYSGSMSAAAYELAHSLSGLGFASEDAAEIQAKVTEAVLGNKSSLRKIAQENGEAIGSGASSSTNDRDESASSTTAGSLGTEPTPAATSPPSTPGSLHGELKAVA